MFRLNGSVRTGKEINLPGTATSPARLTVQGRDERRLKVIMTSHEIIKLLTCLLGGTEAIGDSAYDEVVKENLKKLIDITNWCLDGISQSAETRHRYESSMRDVGETAFSALCEYKEWIEERIERD